MLTAGRLGKTFEHMNPLSFDRTRLPSPHLNDSHAAWRRTVRGFVDKEIAPHVNAWDEEGKFPRELHRRAADIGLLGKNIKLNGEVVEAVDVFAGGAAGCEANFPVKIMEDVPCEDLPAVVAGLVKHGAFKAMRQQLRKIPQAPALGKKPEVELEPAKTLIRADEIKEGAAKLVRVKNEEIAVFKHQGKLCALQNICPHQGGQLSAGWIEDGAAVCPLHGYA